MAQCPGPHSQMVRPFFLVFTYIWPEDVAKISKVSGAPQNVNLAPGNNMARKRNYLLYHFSTTIHLHLASFCFEKKNQVEENECSLNKLLNLK